MPNLEKKQVVIDEIREKVQRSKSMILVDSRGLTVLQDTQLRRSLREAEIDYKVYKNTMINFAIKETNSEALAPFLEGPTAVAFSYDEATKAANIINKHLKDMPNLEFKAGIVEGVLYDAKGLSIVADIPSREVLLSRLLGSLKSPVSTFARVLNALAEEKGGGAGASSDTAETASEPAADPAAAAEPAAASEPAAADPAAEPAAASEPAAAEPAVEPTASEPAASEPTASEPAAEPANEPEGES